MAEKTRNYALTKPAQDEYYDVDIFNDNADIVDTALADYDGRYKVGDIITTARKDMSDKWTLCNGVIIPDAYPALQTLLNTQFTFPMTAGTMFCQLNGIYFKIDDHYDDDHNYSGATIYYTEEFKNKATTWTKFYEGATTINDAYYIKGKYVFTGVKSYSNDSSVSILAFTKAAGAAPVQVTTIGYVNSSSGEYNPHCTGFNGSILAVPSKYYDSGSLTMAINYTTDLDTLKNWKVFKASTTSTSVTYYSIRYEGKYWSIYRSDGLYYSGDMAGNSWGEVKIPDGYTVCTNFCYLGGLYYVIITNTSDKSYYLCYSSDITTLTNNRVKITMSDSTATIEVRDSGLIASQDTGRIYFIGEGKTTWGTSPALYVSPGKYSTSNLPKAGTWQFLSSIGANYSTPLSNCYKITNKQTIIRKGISYLPELPTISPDHSYAYIKKED